MKLDNDIKLCQKNAYLVIGKLTELFLQEIANNAHKICKNSKRKTINLEDINIAIKQNNNTFLKKGIKSKKKNAFICIFFNFKL